jgi:hypothetical protein
MSCRKLQPGATTLWDDCRFQRRVMVLRVVLLQDVLHVVHDLVDLEREEQRLGLEIARLQDEQHPTCQAVVAIGHRAFFLGPQRYQAN